MLRATGENIAVHDVIRQTPRIQEKFDRAKWDALLRCDDDLKSVADKLAPFGRRWVDEFASDYLAINDKAYLPSIMQKLIARIKAEAPTPTL